MDALDKVVQEKKDAFRFLQTGQEKQDLVLREGHHWTNHLVQIQMVSTALVPK